MRASALSDAGRPAQAVKAASMARTIARHAGDTSTAAHATVTLAELAADSFQDPGTALTLTMSAQTMAKGSHVAVLAAVIEANVRAGLGDAPDTVRGIVDQGERLQVGAAKGPIGYQLDGVHPG